MGIGINPVRLVMRAPGIVPTLYLDGMVGEEIRESQVRDFLLQNPGQSVVIEVNSYGGVASEGAAIYARIAEHGSVTCVVNGIAASAASLMIMGAKHIQIRDGAFIMIHEPAGMTLGPASAHRDSAEVLEKMTGVYADIYARRTGLPVAKVRQMMAAETWFTAAESVADGFADEELRVKADEATAFAYCQFRHAPVELLHRSTDRENTMNTNTLMAAPPAPPEEAGISARAYRDILSVATAAKLSLDEFNSVLKDSGGDKRKASNMINEILVARDGGDPVSHNTAATMGGSRADEISALNEAIACGIVGKAPEGRAAAYRGIDMASAMRRYHQMLGFGEPPVSQAAMVDSLLRSGAWMSRRPEMAGGYHTTSDFPGVLADTANRVVLNAYEESKSELVELLCRKGNLANFYAQRRARIGEAESLEEVPEGAEVKYGTRADDVGEQIRLATYGKMFAISRQALINADSAIFDDPLDQGRAAARTVAEKVASLFSANSDDGPTMADGKTWFHADHGNLAGSGAALSTETLSAGREAIRTTKGIDGKTIIGGTPKYLLVPPALEDKARQLMLMTWPTTPDEVNSFAGLYSVIVDPRLPDNAWYLFADPVQMPTLEVAFLNGIDQPKVEMREGWNVLGVEFRTILDFGYAAINYRGVWKNPGA